MKFTCLQENLVKGLSIVSKAVSAKASLPVLSNILLSEDRGRLKLSATNLETAITTWIGASIDDKGAITVPSRIIYELVANLPPSNIMCEVKGSVLHITSGNISSKVNGLDASEFPALPEEDHGIVFTIDPKVFSEAVSETAFAAALDESRPVLAGLLMLVDKDGMSLVAVDGFRLAERKIAMKGKTSDKPFSTIIPAKTILEVARLVASSAEPLKIALNKEENLVIFRSGDLLISSRTLEGDFPDHKKFIPDEKLMTIKAKFTTKDFMNALKLANVFAKDSASVVKFKISPKDGALYVHTSSSELGENKTKLDAEIEGEGIEVAFNSKFIMDVLNNVKAEEFVFECSEKIGPGVPGVLKPFGRSDYTYLAMPMQV